MTTQQVSLNVPEALFQRLKHQAEQSRRSVEEETLNVLAAAVSADVELTPDMAEIMRSLQLLDDSSLWTAARGRMAEQVSAELEALHHKRQRDGLTRAEENALADLLRQYERHMLIRAQAAALLKQRGHNIDELASL